MPSKLFIKHFLLITLIFSVITVVLTFPLILNLNSTIFGFTSDNFATVWFYSLIKKTPSILAPNSITTALRYPIGLNVSNLPPEFGWSIPFLLLTLISNGLVAFNLLIIFGFVFSGVSMYFLIYYLTHDRLVSLFTGFIFAFAPFHFWQGFVHFNLSLLYTLPLYTLALIYFDRQRNFKSSLFLAFSYLFTLFTSLYFGLFVGFMTVGFFTGQILVSLLRRKNYFSLSLIKSGLVTSLLMGLAISPLLYRVFFQRSGFGTYGGLTMRPLNDLLSLSMRPWDFLLPAPNNPYLGQLSNNILIYINSLSADFKTVSAFLPERVVFVGLTTFVIFLVALFFIINRKKHRQLTTALLVSLLTILLVSAPPFIIIKGITFVFPTNWIYPYLPFFRVYARSGIVVLLLILVIVGLGLSIWLVNKKRKKIILVILTTLVFFEFLPFGWGQTTSLKNQPVYDWLKRAPEGTVVAEFPLDFDPADSVIWQMYHNKSLIKSFFGNEIVPLTEVAQLQSPRSWQILNAAGANTVVIHTKYLYDKPHPINDFYLRESTQALKGDETFAKEIARFDNAVIYTPVTKKGKVVYVDGLKDDYQWFYGDDWVWSEADNSVYINNAATQIAKADISFQNKQGKIVRIDLNGENVKNNQLNLRPGLNELIFTNEKPGQSLTITDFNLKLAH